MITKEEINKLIDLGFEDIAGNGFAIRKKITSNLELFKSSFEPWVRMQTVKSGYTMPLRYIISAEELNRFQYAITGLDLSEINLKYEKISP